MTSGTLGAMLISDAIAGRENEWASLFSSTRVKPLAEAPRFLAENARVGVRFIGDRVLSPGHRDIRDLKPGEGAIVISKWDEVAGYRDDEGGLHAVSARCTHLGCTTEVAGQRTREAVADPRLRDPGTPGQRS